LKGAEKLHLPRTELAEALVGAKNKLGLYLPSWLAFL